MKYFVWFFMLLLHTSCPNSKSQSEFNDIEMFNNSYPLTEFELDVDSIDLDLLHKHHGDIPTPILLWIGGFDYIEFKTSHDFINGDSFVIMDFIASIISFDGLYSVFFNSSISLFIIFAFVSLVG